MTAYYQAALITTQKPMYGFGNFSAFFLWSPLETMKNMAFEVSEVHFWFLTEEIQYHDGLRSRELGQAPILLCAPNS